MKLKGKQSKQLSNAILSAYPTKFKLRQMVVQELEQNLDVIALGGSLEEVAFKLIEWAEEKAKVSDLIHAARSGNPDNPELQIFTENFPHLLAGSESGAVDLPCPYLGLSHFREQHEAFFFGRDQFVQQLVEKVHRQNLVVVLGASGSGKSSAVFAGLVPRLRREKDWVITNFRPGSDPFRALLRTLLPLHDPNLSKLRIMAEVGEAAQNLRQGKIYLGDISADILKTQFDPQTMVPKEKLLIVIDQFEELYTLCKDHQIRRNFLDILLDTIELPHRVPLHFVFTLRADFLGQALNYRLFSNMRKDADVKLEPMQPGELEAAIVRPAESLDVSFQDGLVERILGDVGEEPGNLPLLEFALRELWEWRSQDWLTHATYDEIGGVKGALTRHADKVYEHFNAQEREQVRRIFTRLVNPGQGTLDTRCVATRSNFNEQDWNMVKALADERHRLVVTNRTEVGEETVEVIHEALIQNWRQLKAWIDEDRDFRTWQDKLSVSLDQWHDNDRDQDALLRGGFLAVAEDWFTKREPFLSPLEKEYIEASLVYKHQLERRKEQQIREQEAREQQQRRQASVMKIFRIVLGVSVIVALVMIFLAQQAIGGRIAAEAAKQQTDGLRLALASQNQRSSNYEISLLLAIEATDKVNLLEANRELRRSLLHQGQTLARLTDHAPEKVKGIVWGPNNEYFLTFGEKQIKVWDANTRQLINTISVSRNIQHAIWGPDGQFIAVATSGEGDTVQVWSVIGSERHLVLPHTNAVNYLAWNHTGTCLATAGDNKKVILWDMLPSQPTILSTLEHEGDVNFVAWSHDDSRILTISKQQTHVWTIEENTLNPVLTLANEGRLVETAAWNNTETLILTIDNVVMGSYSGNYVYVWDDQTGERLKDLAHPDIITEALWSSDGKHILTVGEDSTARIWNVADGKIERVFTGHEDDINGVVWNNNGSQIMTASKDGTVRIWDVFSGDELIKLTGHKESINQAIWSSDETQAVSVSSDESIRIWSLLPGEELPTLVGHESQITSVAWNYDGTQIVTASEDRTARIWDAETGMLLRTLSGHEGTVNQAVWSLDGNFIVTISNEDVVRFWDARTGDLLATGDAHIAFVNHVDWYQRDENQYQVVTAGEDKTARIWSFMSPDRVALEYTLEVSGPINQAVWNHTGTQVAIAAFDAEGEVHVWDARTDQLAWSTVGHDGNIGYVAWNADDTQLVTASDDKTARIWDVTTGEQLAVLERHDSIVRQATWQPNGEWVLTASDDGTAIIWDTETAVSVCILEGHANKVNQATWDPTGNYIVTASDDGTARIWDAIECRQIALLEGHDEFVNQAVWSPDSSKIVTAGADGTARVYYASPKDLRTLACQKAVRNMSESEWRQFMGSEPYHETCPSKPIPNN